MALSSVTKYGTLGIKDTDGLLKMDYVTCKHPKTKKYLLEENRLR